MEASVTLRPEQVGDAAAIHAIHVAAFPRPDEAHLVDALRAAERLTASLVAVDRAEIVVGHVALSPVTITAEAEGTSPLPVTLLGLGPIAVTPSKQRSGIGSALVRAALDAARQQGVAGVVLIGNPRFYGRFGFVPGSRYHLRWEHDVPEGIFQVIETMPGSLADLPPSVMRYHPAFDGL